MSYRSIKWSILIIPTVVVGVWEYVRHQFLLPYVSMELGNWLTPVFVFAVTITLLRKLFAILEQVQDELNKERAEKSALQERESIARELHDGVAQTLFLLAVKVDQLQAADERDEQQFRGIRKTVHRVNEYVRQAIANLRYPSDEIRLPWMQSVERLVEELQQDTGLETELDCRLDENQLTAKEKVELYASLREALMNVRKHAQATRVEVVCAEEADGWVVSVTDNGQGFDDHGHAEQAGGQFDGHGFDKHRWDGNGDIGAGFPPTQPNHYGLQIMRERARDMGWQLQIKREDGRTIVEIRKTGGGVNGHGDSTVPGTHYG